MKHKKLFHPVSRLGAARQRTAYHEAGHAVMSALLNVPFVSVSLKKLRIDGQALESGKSVAMTYVCTEGLVDEENDTDALDKDLFAGKLDLRRALIAMAGPQAEVIHVGEIDAEAQAAAQMDFNVISACCRIAVAPGVPLEQLKPAIMESNVLSALAAQADEILRERWTVLENVVQALLTRPVLAYAEIRQMVDKGELAKKAKIGDLDARGQR